MSEDPIDALKNLLSSVLRQALADHDPDTDALYSFYNECVELKPHDTSGTEEENETSFYEWKKKFVKISERFLEKLATEIEIDL